jgi:hypothetical protein
MKTPSLLPYYKNTDSNQNQTDSIKNRLKHTGFNKQISDKDLFLYPFLFSFEHQVQEYGLIDFCLLGTSTTITIPNPVQLEQRKTLSSSLYNQKNHKT